MTYIVRTGDTLFTIAQRFNTTVERLIELNNITNPNMILVGMVLTITPEEPSPQPPLEAQWCPRLTLGSRGNAVRELQRLLRDRGFNPGTVDGVFGARTRAAVVSFQRSRNLNATGVVDLNTWRALGIVCQGEGVSVCPTIRQGARGSAVRFIQSLLQRLNFAPGPIDGVFGADTRAAVIAFQASRNIPTTGVVDQATWDALGVTCVPAFPDGTGGGVIPGIPEGDEINFTWEEEDGFRYLLVTNERRYYRGQPVRITFRKRNISDQTVTLRYSTSQLFDFFVSDPNGVEVWRWSEDQSFLPVIREMVLGPGEEETTEIVWNQRTKRGNLVPAQTYTLWGTNKATGKSVTVQFEIFD
ncbi:MAG: LysM peptidoglycan-binding domain-containing protein [Clostridia bacterium]|nr:LysM peptidoglycan-binding domain-containing protein [Clostridia bacterium]